MHHHFFQTLIKICIFHHINAAKAFVVETGFPAAAAAAFVSDYFISCLGSVINIQGGSWERFFCGFLPPTCVKGPLHADH